MLGRLCSPLCPQVVGVGVSVCAELVVQSVCHAVSVMQPPAAEQPHRFSDAVDVYVPLYGFILSLFLCEHRLEHHMNLQSTGPGLKGTG